jgi:alpha/beta superfamily hydrolase
MIERDWLETGDGLKLEMELLGGVDEEGSSRGVAVVCHPHPMHGGDMHNTVVRTLAKAAHEEGYTTLLFNFRGTGRSEGAHTGGLEEVEDLTAAMDRARELAGDGPLLLIGYSFGAMVATKWLNERGGVSGFVGVAVPPTSEYPDFQGIPSLFVNGELDDIAPLDDGLARSLMVDGVHVIIEGDNHFFRHGLDELEEAVRGFIAISCPSREEGEG